MTDLIGQTEQRDQTGEQTQEQKTAGADSALTEREESIAVEPTPAPAEQPCQLRCEYQLDPLGIDDGITVVGAAREQQAQCNQVCGFHAGITGRLA